MACINATAGGLQVHGSTHLLQTVFKYDLVDELWLKIFPLTLGMGKRHFSKGIIPSAFRLTHSEALPKGIIVVTYNLAGHVQTGSYET